MSVYVVNVLSSVGLVVGSIDGFLGNDVLLGSQHVKLGVVEGQLGVLQLVLAILSRHLLVCFLAEDGCLC